MAHPPSVYPHFPRGSHYGMVTLMVSLCQFETLPSRHDSCVDVPSSVFLPSWCPDGNSSYGSLWESTILVSMCHFRCFGHHGDSYGSIETLLSGLLVPRLQPIVTPMASAANSRLCHHRTIHVSMWHFRFFGPLGASTLMVTHMAPSANSRLYYKRMIYASMCHFQFFGRLGAPTPIVTHMAPSGNSRLCYQRIIHVSWCHFRFFGPLNGLLR